MLQRFNVLGVNICAIDMDMATGTIDRWIENQENNYVCIRDVHGVIACQSDDKLRQIHNDAGMVTPDGMPLVWLGRKRGFKFVDRVYGPDLMLNICKASLSRGYRHFFYGGKDGVPELLRDKLVEKYPGLQVVGTYSPPFRPLTHEEESLVTKLIDDAEPDIVWVGLSTPKQERWMAAHIGLIKAPVLIGVGAAFDFHAGLVRQAPRWLQRTGLEWCFRLMSEPRRLWCRYLKTIPLFLFLIAMQETGLKRYQDNQARAKS